MNGGGVTPESVIISPDLPWSGETEGTITLGREITDAQLLAGALTFTISIGKEKHALTIQQQGTSTILLIYDDTVIYTIPTSDSARSVLTLSSSGSSAQLINVQWSTLFVKHAIEVWADEACTVRPTGAVTELYYQFNRSYVYGDDVTYQGENASVQVVTPYDPDIGSEDNYFVLINEMYSSASQSTPIQEGTVMRVAVVDESDPMTDYDLSYGPVMSDSPAIVENSLYIQSLYDLEGAIACRNSNGECVLVYAPQQDGILATSSGRVTFSPSPIPESEDSAKPALLPGGIIFDTISVPTGYKSSQNTSYYYDTWAVDEDTGYYKWSAGIVVDGVLIGFPGFENDIESPYLI